MPHYRKSLVLSFFYKFYWSVKKEVPGKRKHFFSTGLCVDSSLLSVTEPYQHKNSRGVQGFQPASATRSPVGEPLMHLSGLLHSTGEARYTDDIPPQVGELHGALVLSTHAHARISVDWSTASKIAGVRGYAMVQDVPGSNSTGVFGDEEVFADGKVTHFGQVIGIVVAENQMLAQQVASKVEVSYTDLPSIITIEVGVAQYVMVINRQCTCARGS